MYAYKYEFWRLHYIYRKIPIIPMEIKEIEKAVSKRLDDDCIVEYGVTRMYKCDYEQGRKTFEVIIEIEEDEGFDSSDKLYYYYRIKTVKIIPKSKEAADFLSKLPRPRYKVTKIGFEKEEYQCFRNYVEGEYGERHYLCFNFIRRLPVGEIETAYIETETANCSYGRFEDYSRRFFGEPLFGFKERAEEKISTVTIGECERTFYTKVYYAECQAPVCIYADYDEENEVVCIEVYYKNWDDVKKAVKEFCERYKYTPRGC